MRVAVALLLLLLGCNHVAANPLEGAWQSNRDLTLNEFREARSWTPEQWEELASPDFFGHMLYVFHRDHVIVVFEGECSPPSSFEFEPGRSQVLLPNVGPGEGTATLTLEADRLYVPVSMLGGGLRETFTRIDLGSAVRSHSCVGEFVATS